jgi:hypothetical protein
MYPNDPFNITRRQLRTPLSLVQNILQKTAAEKRGVDKLPVNSFSDKC